MIHPLVEARLAKVRESCERFRVARLELFGSAVTGRFDPAASDLDFLVEFEDMEPVALADAYFGLLEALQDLFQVPIDLLTSRAIRNPYFLRSIQPERTLLYAA